MATAGSRRHGTLGSMRPLLVAVFGVAAALPARGDPAEPVARDLCAPGVRHHGAAIDLDVRGAGIHDVFWLLADAGHVNLVIADDVTGTVTLHVVHVPWDAAACAIAGVHHLRIEVQDTILVVMRRASGRAAPADRRPAVPRGPTRRAATARSMPALAAGRRAEGRSARAASRPGSAP